MEGDNLPNATETVIQLDINSGTILTIDANAKSCFNVLFSSETRKQAAIIIIIMIRMVIIYYSKNILKLLIQITIKRFGHVAVGVYT